MPTSTGPASPIALRETRWGLRSQFRRRQRRWSWTIHKRSATQEFSQDTVHHLASDFESPHSDRL